MSTAGPLGAAEAAKQISQMVGFIRKEAEERASDIKRETESEFSAKFLERERLMKYALTPTLLFHPLPFCIARIALALSRFR
jgi:hypothetical protein